MHHCLMLHAQTFVNAYLNIYMINTFNNNASLCVSYMYVIQVTPCMFT